MDFERQEDQSHGCEDSVVNFLRGRGQSWLQMAEDREAWRALDDHYVKAGI